MFRLSGNEYLRDGCSSPIVAPIPVRPSSMEKLDVELFVEPTGTGGKILTAADAMVLQALARHAKRYGAFNAYPPKPDVVRRTDPATWRCDHALVATLDHLTAKDADSPPDKTKFNFSVAGKGGTGAKPTHLENISIRMTAELSIALVKRDKSGNEISVCGDFTSLTGARHQGRFEGDQLAQNLGAQFSMGSSTGSTNGSIIEWDGGERFTDYDVKKLLDSAVEATFVKLLYPLYGEGPYLASRRK